MKITDIKLALARKNLQAVTKNAGAEGKARKLGIIIEPQDIDSLEPFFKLKEDLHLKQQEVCIVFCSEKAVKNDFFEYPVISKEDFGWGGKISEKASEFLNAQYDVLTSFTTSKNKMADFLVSVTRARLKVGRKQSDQNGIFDLCISAEFSEAETFTTELKKYLKILNTTT